MEKVCVIVGPTGVGKTSMSILLAKEYHGEIISGDSMQVYREMNIGTAKIKEEEKQGIPHFLVDEYAIDEEYNVKIFQEKARLYIDEITKRCHLPIICGGTGLYIKSVIYDYRFQEHEDDADFEAFMDKRSTEELWGLLKIIDPKACEKLHFNNRQRIKRALTMAHTGEKKSDIIESQEHKPIYDVFFLGLTMDRSHLYERINQRVDQMMEEGLLEEITNLVSQYDDIWNLQSFQGIGYKEWKEYFDHEQDALYCVEKIKKNSRNFAKRQYTWFNNQMDVHWYDIEQEDYKTKIKEDLESWLNS